MVTPFSLSLSLPFSLLSLSLLSLLVSPSPFNPLPTPTVSPTPTPVVSPTPTPSLSSNRPQLVSSQLLQAERVVGNELYQYTQTALLFDQPLYLNEPLVCAEAEKPCVPNTCDVCDWTGNVEVTAALFSICFLQRIIFSESFYFSTLFFLFLLFLLKFSLSFLFLFLLPPSQPSMCSPTCCGPSQFGFDDSEWCDASLPPWVTVPLNGKSDTYFLNTGGMRKRQREIS